MTTRAMIVIIVGVASCAALVIWLMSTRLDKAVAERDAARTRAEQLDKELATAQRAAGVIKAVQEQTDNERARIHTEATAATAAAGRLNTDNLDPGVCTAALDAYDRLVCAPAGDPVPDTDPARTSRNSGGSADRLH